MSKTIDASISGLRLRGLFLNAGRLLERKYGKSPMWALVSDLTGHGCTMSIKLCNELGFDACATIGENLKARF